MPVANLLPYVGVTEHVPAPIHVIGGSQQKLGDLANGQGGATKGYL